MPDIHDMKAYWEHDPLCSFALNNTGAPEVLEKFDRIKRDDVEQFAIPFWEFEKTGDRRVLDIGCGPTVEYVVAAGARVTSVDPTDTAVSLARLHLQHHGLVAEVRQANAENLLFEDGSFDLVISSKVPHHTPDTLNAFREATRVTRLGRRARITLYGKGLPNSRAVLPVTRAAMKLLPVRHPGADLGRDAQDIEDSVRQYDGRDNPIGLVKTDEQWRANSRGAASGSTAGRCNSFPNGSSRSGSRSRLRRTFCSIASPAPWCISTSQCPSIPDISARQNFRSHWEK